MTSAHTNRWRPGIVDLLDRRPELADIGVAPLLAMLGASA